tara:strand:+ start:2942 stop:3817 length:876 start_codon:yes stop_codon:yes gene_type:complete
MRFTLIFIAFFCIQRSYAEKLDFQTESSTYLIGEPVKYTLSYEGKEGFIWPVFEDTLTKDLEILKTEKIDTLGHGKYQQDIFVTAWDSGYFIVPPIQSEGIQTTPSLLRFNTLPVNPQQDIKPIKEQLDTPFIFAEIQELILWLSLALLLTVAAILLFIYFIKKNKNKPTPEPSIPTRPTMEILWERYYALEQSKIWETGGEKEFQFELSLILRSFLEFKYKTRALEETTKNIILQLTSLGLDRKLKDDVTHILNFSDMVKFAKQKGVFSQHENALNILKETLETHTEEIG